jgi:RNA polymerase sigma-70 factor (ECF subfamily)
MVKDEVQLIKKAQGGDVRAFEELAFRYDRQVLSIAYSFRNSEDDAKDIYQEVFLRVFRGIKKFKFKSEFSTWLFRITTNVCLTQKAKASRHEMDSLNREIGNDEDDETISYQDMLTTDDNTENAVMSAEIKERIDQASGTLPDKQKLAFTLKYIEGYKIKEIAGMMDCTEGTIKRYLFNATNKMKEQLQDLK